MRNSSRSVLYKAVYNNDLEKVELLLSQGSRVENGVLHIAASDGNLPMVEILVRYGVDVNSLYKNVTPLYYTANAEVGKYLIENGADPDISMFNGRRVLHHVSRSGMISMGKMLVQKGADINVQDEEGRTPLHEAAYKGYSELAEFFINNNCRLDLVDIHGNTVLHDAVAGRVIDVIDTILRTVDPSTIINARNNMGDTPLHLASQGRRVRIIELLLRYGARVDIVDNSYGFTALHYAAKLIDGFSTSIILKVKDSLRVINHTDNLGQTPLHKAVIGSSLESVVELLKSGARVDITDIYGRLALHYASIPSNYMDLLDYDIKIVELLLSYGSNPQVQDHEGNTPLHIEVSNRNNMKIIEMLLFYGTNPLIQNQEGNTSLHIAAFNNHKNFIKHLLYNKVNPDTPFNRDGETPRQLMVRLGVFTSQEINNIIQSRVNDNYDRTLGVYKAFEETNLNIPPELLSTVSGFLLNKPMDFGKRKSKHRRKYKRMKSRRKYKHIVNL